MGINIFLLFSAILIIAFNCQIKWERGGRGVGEELEGTFSHFFVAFAHKHWRFAYFFFLDRLLRCV